VNWDVVAISSEYQRTCSFISQSQTHTRRSHSHTQAVSQSINQPNKQTILGGLSSGTTARSTVSWCPVCGQEKTSWTGVSWRVDEMWPMILLMSRPPRGHSRSAASDRKARLPTVDSLLISTTRRLVPTEQSIFTCSHTVSHRLYTIFRQRTYRFAIFKIKILLRCRAFIFHTPRSFSVQHCSSTKLRHVCSSLLSALLSITNKKAWLTPGKRATAVYVWRLVFAISPLFDAP